jgi:hypothetical protein
MQYFSELSGIIPRPHTLQMQCQANAFHYALLIATASTYFSRRSRHQYAQCHAVCLQLAVHFGITLLMLQRAVLEKVGGCVGE